MQQLTPVMKLSGAYPIKASRQRVWEGLNNPDVLTRCIPGCEKLERTADNQYVAHLKVGVAAIKGNYTGKVSLQDIVAPTSYTLVVEGKGGPGWLKGASKIALADQDAGTEVRYEADLQVGGLIAAVGSRMIEGAGKMMADQFFKALAAQMEQ